MSTPFNQDTDPTYNMEPGITVTPGSPYAKYMASFEQFPSVYSPTPGNPYQYRPYPKMLYRAEHWGGKRACMAAPPDPVQYADPREYERAADAAMKFTERCQRIVKDEVERSRAFEDGWRESPEEALAYLKQRDDGIFEATAHRNYEDRNMSEAAKREIAEAQAQVDGHMPEVPRKRGRPRKTA